MRAALIALAALVFGIVVGLTTALAEAQWGPTGCPVCTPPGPCSLIACVIDFRSHVVVPLLVGVVGAVLAVLALRRIKSGGGS